MHIRRTVARAGEAETEAQKSAFGRAEDPCQGANLGLRETRDRRRPSGSFATQVSFYSRIEISGACEKTPVS